MTHSQNRHPHNVHRPVRSLIRCACRWHVWRYFAPESRIIFGMGLAYRKSQRKIKKFGECEVDIQFGVPASRFHNNSKCWRSQFGTVCWIVIVSVTPFNVNIENVLRFYSKFLRESFPQRVGSRIVLSKYVKTSLTYRRMTVNRRVAECPSRCPANQSKAARYMTCPSGTRRRPSYLFDTFRPPAARPQAWGIV